MIEPQPANGDRHHRAGPHGYEALEETAEILSGPDAMTALEAGLAELSRDETVPLEDLRRELAERRARR